MCEEDENRPHIIIDNGSGYMKAGLCGEEGPRSVFPSIVGCPKHQKYKEFTLYGENKEFYIGTDAEANRGILNITYPIEHGVINNLDHMEKIWGHIFTNELRVAPEEHNVMITEFSRKFENNRNKIAQIMFETFNVPGLYMINPAVLTLYSAGKFTGFALDLGDGITQFLPIFDGYSLIYTDFYNFGGRDLTKYFMRMLFDYGHTFYKTNEWEIVKQMKEKACYVALDYEDELKSYEPFDYELPDGNHIIIKDQRISVPEAIFKPSLIKTGEESFQNYNIPKTCCDLIQKYDEDLRKDLYNSIILSGGNSMFNGLPERLTKEIKALAPESMKEEVNVIASCERKFNTWFGGSILSSISTFESCWITKTEYEEYGETIVRRKCLFN